MKVLANAYCPTRSLSSVRYLTSLCRYQERSLCNRRGQTLAQASAATPFPKSELQVRGGVAQFCVPPRYFRGNQCRSDQGG
eukprot:688654-Rhodomonas_salina.1